MIAATKNGSETWYACLPAVLTGKLCATVAATISSANSSSEAADPGCQAASAAWASATQQMLATYSWEERGRSLKRIGSRGLRFTQSAGSQETLSQETLSQETLSQETLSQETLSQDTLSQDTLSHDTVPQVWPVLPAKAARR